MMEATESPRLSSAPGPETQLNVDLSKYTTCGFDRGGSRIKESLWIIVGLVLFRLCPLSVSRLKCFVLRAFGAKIGRNVTIKPQVKITFPWKLIVGDCVWLGEECWLLNLDYIDIGNNVCISQRAFLCTGSHDRESATFNLITKPIHVECGAWIAASAWVGPGVTVGVNSVLSAGSVATRDIEPHSIYKGNPASFLRKRVIKPSI